LGLGSIDDQVKLLGGVILTTIAWLIVTYRTQPTDHQTLLRFYRLIRPAATGWRPVINYALGQQQLKTEEVNPGRLPLQILAMFVACITVYATLFSTGYFIYGHTMTALVTMGIAIVGIVILFSIWKKLDTAVA
ncbi:MAG: Na+:solute symporter, partial [Bacteroidota bacterium]